MDDTFDSATVSGNSNGNARYFREAVYRSVFSTPENMHELYKSLDPEAAENLTPDDYSKVNATSNPAFFYDGIAFRAGDSVVTVQDMGTDWSEILLANGAFYVIDAMMTDATDRGISEEDIYGLEPVHLSMPKAFSVYSGEITKPAQENGAQVEYTLGSLGYTPTIRTEGAVPGDILDQYMEVGIICDEEADRYDTPHDAAVAISRRCLERGLLPQYFERDETPEEMAGRVMEAAAKSANAKAEKDSESAD